MSTDSLERAAAVAQQASALGADQMPPPLRGKSEDVSSRNTGVLERSKGRTRLTKAYETFGGTDPEIAIGRRCSLDAILWSRLTRQIRWLYCRASEA